MSKRVKDITRKLNARTEEGISQGLDQIKLIDDFAFEEKIILSEALTSIFYHFHSTDTISALRTSVLVEHAIAALGDEIIPFLFNEIVEADGESSAYLGKAYAKIGKAGRD